MPIVEAKCTNCGANLKVDSNKDVAICDFCGSSYIVEKAIQNYSITNNNQIHADVVNIYGNSDHIKYSDFEITAGKLTKYNGSSVDVVIPEGVLGTGIDVFADTTFLQSIVLPSSLTEIGQGTFSFCKNLTSVTIPNGVTTIGKHAFYGCEKLTSISLPDSVTTIGDEAFAYCENLVEIHIPNSVVYIGYGAFTNCSSLRSITIPDGVQEINFLNNYDRWVGVVDGCSSLEEINFPSKFKPDYFMGSLWFEYYKNECQEHNSHTGKCYIATCVYGSYDCPQVCTLRRFRDNTLARTWCGRLFVFAYYAVSPTLVRWFGNSDWFKKFWKERLDKMVGKLQEKGFKSTPYQDIEWQN